MQKEFPPGPLSVQCTFACPCAFVCTWWMCDIFIPNKWSFYFLPSLLHLGLGQSPLALSYADTTVCGLGSWLFWKSYFNLDRYAHLQPGSTNNCVSKTEQKLHGQPKPERRGWGWSPCCSGSPHDAEARPQSLQPAPCTLGNSLKEEMALSTTSHAAGVTHGLLRGSKGYHQHQKCLGQRCTGLCPTQPRGELQHQLLGEEASALGDRQQDTSFLPSLGWLARTSWGSYHTRSSFSFSLLLVDNDASSQDSWSLTISVVTPSATKRKLSGDEWCNCVVPPPCCRNGCS